MPAHPMHSSISPLSLNAMHLCIDMQVLFAEETPWHTPWMTRVLPKIESLAEARPADTIFTRFITPKRPEDLPGAWKTFYERWPQMTREQLAPRFLELVEPLRRLAPPALVLDKRFFSPFHDTELADLLRTRSVETIVITGAETDMCVLAAVLDAVDLGFRVVLPEDALCSSSDEMHDAVLRLYRNRFSCQIETTDTESVLRNWTAPH
jgi:nicotinamidase-related amidase